MGTREVIEKYYEYVRAGDWDAWLELFADDLVMDEQLAGHVEGIGAMRDGVGGLKKGYARFLMTPLEIVVEGDRGCVLWHCEAESADGKPIDAKGANYFVVRDGKITYMSNFHDSVPFKPFLDYMAQHGND